MSGIMKYALALLFLMFCLTAGAQLYETSKSIPSTNSAQRARAADLSKSLEKNSSDKTIATDYENLAKEFSLTGEHAKAEDYFERALKLYIKLKDKDKITGVEREIAKQQEAQNKIEAAIISYTNASKSARNKLDRDINNNDAKRLRNISDLSARSSLVQKNMSLLVESERSEEKARVFNQMADINMELGDKDAAIENLQVVAEIIEEPELAADAEMKIVGVLTEDSQYERAISFNESILQKAEETKDSKTQIRQLKNISSAYIGSKDTSKGIESLTKAYEIAIEGGHTFEAIGSLELLVKNHIENNDQNKALDIYSDFVTRLDDMIVRDSTLINNRMFQMHEDRITRLEKERELKDELIRRKNVLNKVFAGSIILMLGFLVLIVRALYSIRKKNKKIALQSLRREMNPHFIFNSLNSVNQFIAQNNELEANKYLSSYSRLMRNMMENSNKDFTSLSTELEQLRQYLELEHMRFSDKFTYSIDIDNSLDSDSVYVPNMLIQPQLENAIWHGLRYKDTGGLLKLSVIPENDCLVVKIEDNGIGIKNSQTLKTKHQKSRTSRGISNTLERIQLLNSLYNCKITFVVTDREEGDTGVTVEFRFPVNCKKYMV